MLNASTEEWQRTAREKAHAVAADLQIFLTDLCDALAHDEAEVERAFAGRAVPALATALAVGIAIGFFVRKRP